MSPTQDTVKYPRFHHELVENAAVSSLEGFENLLKNGHAKAFVHAHTKLCLNWINKDHPGYLFKPCISMSVDQKLSSFAVAEQPTWTMFSAMSPFFRLPQSERKTYVFSPDFFEKFRDLKLDLIQYRHLPERMCGFVQLPKNVSDGANEFNSFYFFVGPKSEMENASFGWSKDPKITRYEPSGNVLGIGFIDKDLETANFVCRQIPADRSMLVKDTFANLEVQNFNSRTLTSEIVHKEDGYDPHVALFINTLAYLNSGDPDLREYKNPVKFRSPTSKTPVRADSDCSTTEIVRVGFGYKKERQTTSEEWAVAPFMRWQRCGEGNSDIKLVWVKGHTRQWRKEEVEWRS